MFACRSDSFAAGGLFTVTLTAAEVVLLFAASSATAVRLTAALADVVVFQFTVYGAVVSLPSEVAPAKNSTLATPLSSAAVAVTATVPATVAAAVGAVTLTVGAIVSGAVAPRSIRP